VDNPVNFPVNNVLMRVYTPGQIGQFVRMKTAIFEGFALSTQFSRIHPHEHSPKLSTYPQNVCLQLPSRSFASSIPLYQENQRKHRLIYSAGL